MTDSRFLACLVTKERYKLVSKFSKVRLLRVNFSDDESTSCSSLRELKLRIIEILRKGGGGGGGISNYSARVKHTQGKRQLV